MDQARPVRAQWVYHHYSDADPQRIAALQQADPALAGAVDALKSQQVPVNSGFIPAGLPPGEMYRDEDTPAEVTGLTTSILAEESWDPPPNPTPANHYTAPGSTKGPSWLVLIASSAFMVWLIFFKRWKTATA
jgi:hypothetical protein